MFQKTLFKLACWSVVFFLTFAVGAQIVIDGVTDKATYNDSVSFRVQTNAAYTYEVTLNGQPAPAGVFNAVSTMDYYDLFVRRTQISDSSVTTGLVRFIVLSSERGAPEKGLIKWTPYPSIPSTASEFAGAQLRLIAPQAFPRGFEIPIVAWVEDSQGNERRANGFITAAGFESSPIKVLRGLGSGFVPPQTNAGILNYDAQLQSLTAPKQINIEPTTTWVNVSGILNGATTWADNSRIFLTGNITIPQGSSLTIGAGTVVRLNPLVNITNLGRIVINGAANQPVVFTPTNHILPEDSGGAWGGFVMRANTSELVANYAIFNGGGGANSWSFSPGSSHKSQQPVLFAQFGAQVTMTNCAIISTHGQVGNGYQARLTLDHCLYQRAITSGEYDTCTNIYNHCAIIEFPEENGNVDAVIADADYDAIYMIKGTNLFLNTLVGFSKDDAIDSGSDSNGDPLGSVRVEHCWIESALHECLAWSGHNRKTWAYDSVLMNSGQGIENGWTDGSSTYSTALTTPDCFADRLLSTGNSVGARVGDNYNWAYRGFLRLTNSLLLYNYRNVFLKTWNGVGTSWDTNSWADRLGQISLDDCALGAADARFPSTPAWNPDTDSPRLAAWMTTPPDAPVGIGLAVWPNLASAPLLSNGVPVRLSSFTTNSVSVHYAVETPDSILGSGMLTFAPGETLKKISISPASASGHEIVRVTLSDPAGGEITGARQTFLITFPGGPVVSNTTFMAFGASWKYLDDGSNQGTGWRAPGFNDTSWPSGPGQLGFGDNDEGTLIRSNRTDLTRIATYYFRKPITVANQAQFGNFAMRLLRDDAGIVYFNGTEVFRSPNMPPGTINFDTVTGGTAPPDNTIDTTNIVNTGILLSNGVNVIACEIHQQALSSSDLSFDLELIGQSVAPRPRLFVNRFGNELALYWNDPTYFLEQANDVTGPWSATPGGLTSPVSVAVSQAKAFYRLRKP